MMLGSSVGRFVRIPLISGRLPASQELTIKSGAYMKVGYSPKGKCESAPVAASIVEEALKVLEGRWKMVILFHLFSNGTMRFSELERGIVGVTQKMLIQQLRDLEHDGVIIRTVYPEVPPKVEYSLTPLGKELCPVLEGLLLWAEKRQQAIKTQKKDVKAKKAG
jgi:DNA-binding HxlR family transcriptional regulator